MAELFLCRISALQEDSADVYIPERGDMVITEVPFLEKKPEGIQVNSAVFALFEEREGKLERGCILGRPARRHDG